MFQNPNNCLISGGTFQNISSGTTDADNARNLLARHIAPNALPDSAAMYDAPKCYPETRIAINRKLQRWIRQQDDRDIKFMWLHGGAGAGKSAIMRTTALGGPTKQGQDAITGPPRVLGSFFFSKDDPTRNTAGALIPTLAFQLCKAHPAAREAILQTIADNREIIFTTSLLNQVRALLVQPLAALEAQCGWLSHMDQVQDETQPGRVFIIDGLDECSNPKQQTAIIEAISILVKDLPVRVLLASRPDEPIPSTIHHSALLRGIHSEMCLSDDPDSDADIRIFLEESLKEVREQRNSQFFSSLLESWPTEHDIEILVCKSSKHFIYASTALKYIASGDERPDVALRVILGLQAARTGYPFNELDTLYRHILLKARFRKEVLEVISFRLFSTFYPFIGNICSVLGYSLDDIRHFLSDMRALVIIDDHNWVILRHKSLEDFLRDRPRARELYIGTARQFHREHLQRYFALLDSIPTPSESSLTSLGGSDDLIMSIATGIAASPLSDTVTTLIKCHPPRIIHKFLGLPWDSDENMVYAYASYMKSIVQYDFENKLVLQDALEDFLASMQEINIPRAVIDTYLDDIIVPLVLIGFDIKTLFDIFYADSRSTATSYRPLFNTFCDGDSGDPICHHRYPFHVLRRIRTEMTDANDKLAGATLKMLQLVTKDPGWFGIRFQHPSSMSARNLVGNLLEAIQFALPRTVYSEEIAFYAVCQLPTLSDLQTGEAYEGSFTDQEMDHILRRARRIMNAYLQRGGDPLVVDQSVGHMNTGDSEVGDAYSGDKFPPKYDPECRLCNQNVDV